MFERFTDRARRVVVLAQEEARLLNHDYIGTEHLLLGLLHELEGLAAKALFVLDLQLDQVRNDVETRIGVGKTTPQGHMPFTPRAKTVLELSLRESLRLGHDYIGTEHILLALVREGEGVAAQILMTKVEGGLERVREQIEGMMGGVAPPLGELPQGITRLIADLADKGRLAQDDRERLESVLREQFVEVGQAFRSALTSGPRGRRERGNDMIVRLEAIEARLSAIEALLRNQRDEDAS